MHVFRDFFFLKNVFVPHFVTSYFLRPVIE